MSGAVPFGGLDTDRLTGLVFELAAQLHVERSRRLALETALVHAGVIAADAVEAAGDNETFLGRTRQELDESMRKLMRVLLESGDVRAPLRPEAPNEAGGQD